MHDAYAPDWENEAECFHNYIWMMQWLKTSMELSQITRSMIQSRVLYLNAQLEAGRKVLDAHVEVYTAMRADGTVDESKLEDHRLSGFKLEAQYNSALYLSCAMDIVDMIADQLKNQQHWKKCDCGKCCYYRSTAWLRDQPADLTPEPVPSTPAGDQGLRYAELVVGFRPAPRHDH